MTVIVGNVRFDSHEPTPMPQHPLTEGQRFTWQTQAEAFKIEGSPPVGEGGLIAHVALDGPDSRDRYTGRLADMVGALVSVDFGGGAVISGLYLADVSTDWRANRNSEGQGILTAAFAFGRPSRDTIGGDFVHVKVFTSDTLEDENGPSWVEQVDLRCISAVDGFFPLIGSASLIQYANEGDTVPDIVGKYVRLDFPDDITNPTAWAPAWYGFAAAPTYQPDTADVRRVFVAWDCSQITGELQAWLRRWYETNKSGPNPTAVYDPGRILPPNTFVDAQDRGGSAAIRPGVNAEVHDRTQVGFPWRVKQYLETVLAGAFNDATGQLETDVAVQFSGQTDILNGFIVADYEGLPISDMIADAMRYGNGCFVSVTGVDPNTVLGLEVRSVLPAAITAAGVVFPAGIKATTVDLDLPEIGDDWAWTIDDSKVADEVLLWGAETWYMATFGTDDTRGDDGAITQFEPAWDASLEAAFDTAFATESLRDVLASPDMSQVWRVFRLRDDWRGQCFEDSSTRLLTERATVTDDNHGVGGESGVLTEPAGAAASFSPAAVKLTRTLPIDGTNGAGIAGEAWVGGPSSTPDSITGPLVPSGAGAGEGGFFRIEDRGGPSEKWFLVDMQFQVNPENNTVTLGRTAEDADQIRQWLDDGQFLAFTVGFTGPQTFRTSWRRDPAQRPRKINRVVVHHADDLFLRYAINNTVTVIDDGVPKYTLAQELGEPVADRADDQLALLRMYHGEPAYSLQYSRPGVIDTRVDEEPGTRITNIAQATIGPIDTSATTLHITTRRWDFDRSIVSTTIECTTATLEGALTYVRTERRANARPLFGAGALQIIPFTSDGGGA